MKYLLPFFLLPSLALAQAPEGQTQAPEAQVQGPTFDQFKQSMQPIMEKSLPAMQETRQCINKANSKEDVEKCMNTMAERVKEIQKQAGGQEKAVTSKAPDDFKWNPETKEMMLKNMDRSIKQNTAMLECLGKSGNREEMGSCMRSKLPAPKKTSAPKK